MDFETHAIAQLRAAYPELQFFGARTTILPHRNLAGGKLQIQDDTGRLRVRVLASTPAKNDHGFAIDPAAFVGARDEYMKNPMQLAYHDFAWPTGKNDLGYEVSPHGLTLEGWVSASEPGIQTKILDGTLSQASITALPLARETRNGVETWTSLRLFEQSWVPWGSDPGTMVEPVGRMEAATVAAITEPMVMDRREFDALVAGTLHAARELVTSYRGAIQERVRRHRLFADAAEILSRGDRR